MLSLYVGRVAKWAMPDRVIFAERLPVGATGKVLKNKLRELCGKIETADRTESRD